MPGMEEEYVPNRSGLSYFFYIIAIKYNLWTGKGILTTKFNDRSVTHEPHDKSV